MSEATSADSTDTTYTVGGAADLWGRSWTDTEVGNSVFRMKLDKSTDSDHLTGIY